MLWFYTFLKKAQMNQEQYRLSQEILKYFFFCFTVKAVQAKERNSLFYGLVTVCQRHLLEGFGQFSWQLCATRIRNAETWGTSIWLWLHGCKSSTTGPCVCQGSRAEFLLTAREPSAFEWRLTHRALGFTDATSDVYIVLSVFQL